jgi:hypothetical protein
VAGTIDVVRTIKLATGNAILTAWVAEEAAERAQGVRGLTSLRPDVGMLLLFGNSGQHGVTMRGVAFPLDIVWLDAHLRVTSIAHRVVPETPIIQGYGTSVLELAAGQATILGLAAGSRLHVVATRMV